MLPWCVLGKDGWCVAASQESPPESGQEGAAFTLCGFFIHLNFGVERREPTCPDCVGIYNAPRPRKPRERQGSHEGCVPGR